MNAALTFLLAVAVFSALLASAFAADDSSSGGLLGGVLGIVDKGLGVVNDTLQGVVGGGGLLDVNLGVNVG